MSNITSTNFSSGRFIRTGGGIRFEERAAQPSDFTGDRNLGGYAAEFAASPAEFAKKYPEWQNMADGYVMRRAIITITGRQTCRTSTFKANDLERFVEPGFVRIGNFAVPGSDASSIPKGKYQLTDFSFADQGNGYTEVTVPYQQKQKWELVDVSKYSG